jgi:hypothetical protein
VKNKAIGYVLQRIPERNVVIIATGFGNKSTNSKTGGMIQIYIIRDDMSPIEAVKRGLDSAICFDCPARGNGIDGTGRYCYVTLMHGPTQVYKSFKRGRYQNLETKDYHVFSGRAVRFGSYGDPILLSPHKVARICSVAAKWTGYTHQWMHVGNEWANSFFMASADSVHRAQVAQSEGWRTFRVSNSVSPLENEISCPASAEMGHKTQCASCGLCKGAGMAKNITIQVHGSQSRNAFTILQ